MVDMSWAGCGECDSSFACHNGETRCCRLESLREPQGEPTADTACWKCDWLYSYRLAACPKCGATNGNVDLEKAQAEVSPTVSQAPEQPQPIAWRVRRGGGSYGYLYLREDLEFWLKQGPDVPSEVTPLYERNAVVLEGRQYETCDCDPHAGPCKLGLERRLLTTELSRCMISEAK